MVLILEKDVRKRNKWMNPPEQRHRKGEKQTLPHVDWGVLYFDLFYVALAFNVSHMIVLGGENSVAEILLYTSGTFLPTTQFFWIHKMTLDAAFHTQYDVVHRFWEITVLATLGTAVLYIRPVEVLSRPSEYFDMFAFCLANFMGLLLHNLNFAEIAFFWVVGERNACKFAKNMIFATIPAAALLLVASIYSAVQYFGTDVDTDIDTDTDTDTDSTAERALGESDPDKDELEHLNYAKTDHVPIYLCNLAWLVFILGAYLCRVRSDRLFKIPLNSEFISHRFGEFVTLMLGEGVLTILTTDGDSHSRYLGTFYMSLLTITSMQVLHFWSQPHHANQHAITKSHTRGFLFTTIVQMYGYSLVILGASYNLLIRSSINSSKTQSGSQSRLLAEESIVVDDYRGGVIHSIGLALTFFFLDVMLSLHNEGQISKHPIIWTIRLAIVAFTATLFLYTPDPDLHIGVGLITTLLQVALRSKARLFFTQKKNNDNSHDHEKGHDHEEE